MNRLFCISMESPPTFKCIDVPSWRVFTKEEMRAHLENTLKVSEFDPPAMAPSWR